MTSNIDHWFKYHPPQGDQVERYTKIREAARAFATLVAAEVPPGLECDAAILKIREAVMLANAGIACYRPDVGPPTAAPPPRSFQVNSIATMNRIDARQNETCYVSGHGYFRYSESQGWLPAPSPDRA